jgi:methionyl aminopeptidase
MVLTVEPALVLGSPAVLSLDDGWTVVTVDRSAAAHVEETVAVTRAGALVLTAL